jgi:hypothetical protein
MPAPAAKVKIPGVFTSFGEANADKIFYLIWRKDLSGFFSNIFHVISHLRIAESLNLIPVVDMQNYQTKYSEKEPINGTANAWEYYFAPVSHYSLTEVYKSKNVLLCDGQARFDVYTDIHKSWLLINKYIKVRPELNDYVDAFWQKHFVGKSVLAVHFRGQDMKRVPEHPTPPTCQQIIMAVRNFLAQYPIDKIFLATDDKGYEEKLRKQFSDKIIAPEHFRVNDGVDAFAVKPYPRHQHLYKLGFEVLTEAMLLSKADYFICGGIKTDRGYEAAGSNVALYAQILNKQRYKAMYAIDNGINQPNFLLKLRRAIQANLRKLLEV